MAFQFTLLCEGAPAIVAVICFPFLIGLSNSLVREDQVEVGSLSCGMMSPMFWLNPCSPHYKATFAFSTLLCPLFHWPALRFAFPKGEQRAYHVPHK
jgi:hypothetical protein